MKYLINRDIPIIISLITIFIALPLRVNQLLFQVDANTGFYTSNSLSVIALNLLIIFSSFIVLIFVGIGAKKIDLENPINNTRFIGSISLMLAASLLIEGVYHLILDYGNISMIVLSSLAFMVVSSFVFIYIGIIMLQNKMQKKELSIITVTLTIWACLKLIASFIKYTTIVGISDNVFEIVFNVLLMLFIFNSSRIFIGDINKKIYTLSVASGLIMAIIGISTVLPHLIIGLSQLQNISNQIQVQRISDLFLCIFALSFAGIFTNNN